MSAPADKAAVKPVDVLAVLDRIASLPLHECDDARNQAGLEIAKREAAEARAAVAEVYAQRDALLEAQQSQAEALRQIIAVLEHYRTARDFDARLDAWIGAHAFDADKADAALARATGAQA